MSAYKLDDLISMEKFNEVLLKALSDQEFELKKFVLNDAADGLLGFLGDHLKLKVHVSVDNNIEELNFFIKCLPKWNLPKMELIKKGECFVREEFMYRLFASCKGEQDWHPKIYFCSQELLIMSDLSFDGYRSHIKYDYLDLNHCKLVLASMAKLHATSNSYEINKSTTGNKYRIIDENRDMFKETFLIDGPWLKAGNKVIYDIIKTFLKFENITEDKLYKAIVEACDSVKFYHNAVNVIIHKDLWANNMLFKYDENKNPINAVLLDFQNIKYAPPAFDVMTMIYLNTSRKFREINEPSLIEYYIEALKSNFEGETLLEETEFHHWLEKARIFGIVTALMIYPFILLDEETSKKLYDNPDTYDHLMNVDRSGPFIEYCYKSKVVKERFVTLCEELVELI